MESRWATWCGSWANAIFPRTQHQRLWHRNHWIHICGAGACVHDLCPWTLSVEKQVRSKNCMWWLSYQGRLDVGDFNLMFNQVVTLDHLYAQRSYSMLDCKSTMTVIVNLSRLHPWGKSLPRIWQHTKCIGSNKISRVPCANVMLIFRRLHLFFRQISALEPMNYQDNLGPTIMVVVLVAASVSVLFIEQIRSDSSTSSTRINVSFYHYQRIWAKSRIGLRQMSSKCTLYTEQYRVCVPVQFSVLIRTVCAHSKRIVKPKNTSMIQYSQLSVCFHEYSQTTVTLAQTCKRCKTVDCGTLTGNLLGAMLLCFRRWVYPMDLPGRWGERTCPQTTTGSTPQILRPLFQMRR